MTKDSSDFSRIAKSDENYIEYQTCGNSVMKKDRSPEIQLYFLSALHRAEASRILISVFVVLDKTG